MSEPLHYESRYSYSFADELDRLSQRAFDRVMTVIDLLEMTPNMGAEYDPDYEAMEPPVACRQMYVPKTSKVLYYCVNEDQHTVDFLTLCDARSNPKTRFTRTHSARQ